VNLVATKIDIDNLVIGKDISNTPETAYTVAQARTLIAEGEGLDHKVYVKGTVKGTPAIDTGFGNATYWITDGKDTLEVYRGLYLKEEKFVNTEALKAGDEVIVYGQLVDYNGTYEFTQGNYLYSINGSTDKPQDKPVVTFTDVTIAEAVEWIGGVTNAIKYDYNKTLKLKDAEVVFYSANDPVIARHIGELKCKTIPYQAWEGELPFIDRASKENAGACAAVAEYLFNELGVKNEHPGVIAERLKRLEPVAMRLEVKEGQHGCTLINDSYNSDINSLNIALDFMARREETQRTLILSDIYQSGMSDYDLYSKVNSLCVERGVQHLIAIGPRINA
jgi:RPA family protein